MLDVVSQWKNRKRVFLFFEKNLLPSARGEKKRNSRLEKTSKMGRERLGKRSVESREKVTTTRCRCTTRYTNMKLLSDLCLSHLSVGQKREKKKEYFCRRPWVLFDPELLALSNNDHGTVEPRKKPRLSTCYRGEIFFLRGGEGEKAFNVPSLASSTFFGFPQRSSMMRLLSAAFLSCSFFNSSAAFLRSNN